MVANTYYIKDDIRDKIIYNKSTQLSLLSMGVLPQTTWFGDSVSMLLFDCFNAVDLFNEDEKQNLINIYYKHLVN